MGFRSCYLLGFLFVCINITGSFGVNLETLRLVQVVYRHGDRAPLHSYPNDPYRDAETYWPMGMSQLTEMGKQQQYELGCYLRGRYNGYLSPEYHPKQIHVLSSDTDRTLQSAEANLAGLYPKLPEPPAGNGTLKTVGFSLPIDLQLVPIHTLSEDTDKELKMTAPCPRRDEELLQYMNTSIELKSTLEANQGLYEFVKEKAGFKKDMDFFRVMRVHSTLYCQKVHNFVLPSWANSTVMEGMAAMRSLGFFRKGGTPTLRRLYGGPLVKRLLDNMARVERGRKESKKHHRMYMHSAHDDTLAAVMTSMGIFHPQIPAYASVFIVELHQEKPTGRLMVEIFYRNTTEREPYPLQVPGCGSPCYFQELVQLLAPTVPTNWRQECQLLGSVEPEGHPSGSRHNNVMSIFYFVLVIISVILVWLTILYLIIGCCKSRGTYKEREAGPDKGTYAKLP